MDDVVSTYSARYYKDGYDRLVRWDGNKNNFKVWHIELQEEPYLCMEEDFLPEKMPDLRNSEFMSTWIEEIDINWWKEPEHHPLRYLRDEEENLHNKWKSERDYKIRLSRGRLRKAALPKKVEEIENLLVSDDGFNAETIMEKLKNLKKDIWNAITV